MHRSRPAGEQVEVNFHVLGARNPKAPSSLEYESSRGAGPAKAASRGLGTAAAAVKHHPRRLTEVAATALISGSTMCIVQSDVHWQSESSSNAPLPAALVRGCVVRVFGIKRCLTSRNLCVVTFINPSSTIRCPHHSGASFSHKSFKLPPRYARSPASPASAWRDRPTGCSSSRRFCKLPFGPDPRPSLTLGCTVADAGLWWAAQYRQLPPRHLLTLLEFIRQGLGCQVLRDPVCLPASNSDPCAP